MSNTWQTAGGVVIGPDYQTAGGGWASVRQWVAPHDGTIRIEAAPRFDGAAPGELSLVVTNGAEKLWDLVNGTANSANGTVTIRGQAPLAELSGYQSRLNALTAGQGRYTISLSHYEAVPPNVQAQLVAQHQVHDED